MNDLIRSYKMVVKRRRSIDSEESQPLLSSRSSSNASFGAFQERCMFQDSVDTTEPEVEKSSKAAAPVGIHAAPTPTKSSPRRPFSYPGRFDSAAVDIIYANSDRVCERYQYFMKISGDLNDNSYMQAKLLSVTYANSDPETQTTPIRTQNSLVTIFAVWNTIMGSSLLAMAWGLEKSGFLPGIFLHGLIAGICMYTAYVILKINENYGAFGGAKEVPDLCGSLLGKWAEAVAKVFSLIVLIGSNIVYWILMSNFLYNTVHFVYGFLLSRSSAADLIGNDTVLCPKNYVNVTPVAGDQSPTAALLPTSFDDIWDLYRTVPLFLAVLMFPLLNFKSPTFFTKFNSLGTLSVMYLLVFAAVKSYGWGIHIPNWTMMVSLKPSFCALSGMLSLSYFIHNIIISVMRNNRQQEKNGRDLCIAYGLVLFTYLFLGVSFYVTFPLAKSCIEDNILNNFPKYDHMTLIARLLLLFQLFTVFPLMTYMLRRDIFANFSGVFNTGVPSEFSYFKVIAVNALVVVVCVLFACFLPRIGTLIRYTGAISGMIYVFALPSLLKMAALKSEKSLTAISFVVHVAIILIGLVNLLSQFFIVDR